LKVILAIHQFYELSEQLESLPLPAEQCVARKERHYLVVQIRKSGHPILHVRLPPSIFVAFVSSEVEVVEVTTIEVRSYDFKRCSIVRAHLETEGRANPPAREILLILPTLGVEAPLIHN
jgi:hypothetical protein